jgi:hypothetical protein
MRKIILSLVILLFCGGGYFLWRQSHKKKNTIETIQSLDMDLTLDYHNLDIDWSTYKTEKIELSDSIDIQEGGIYILSGTLEDGSITIDTEDYVKLILNQVSIKNANGPALYIKNSKATFLSLEEGTENRFEDGSTRTTESEELDGVIYSKDDLFFEGKGTLYVTSNYQDGIVSKDNIEVTEGVYRIDAKDDGIRGKDSISILGGTFDITALGDGLKTTNTTDAKKGFILIENGDFTIEAENDGMDAETKVLIQEGTFLIKTGGGSEQAESTSEKPSFSPRETKVSSNTASKKGIKAGDNLVIQGGTFTFDTVDDSIHSNTSIGIKDGEFTISSGDDGIHADETLLIEGGNLSILKSYEGIEASNILIQNGTITIISDDDGMNAASKKDPSNRMEPFQNKNQMENWLKIYGGVIDVNANGDGIDVNGNGYVYGGEITVDGPSDNGNGALDYDGEFVVDGGEISLIGSSGMLQGISSSSKQYNITIGFEETYEEKSQIEIIDTEGNNIFSKTADKSFSSLVFSSNQLQKDHTYTIKINEKEVQTFTITSITTTVGNVDTMRPRKRGGKENPPQNRPQPMP